ncbi:MAG: 1-acyl-sn-glycerol-3-phosphate acyltransferase [Bacteroidaceae bacterium]|nr:1-acyl-sn-glycerol-3-phosphate acyltransferase [Bacteroidaceae bacterium]
MTSASMESKKTLRDRGICVVIPTYNNAGTIADVVRRTLTHCLDVIVVADGCTDGTLEILQNIEGITIVSYAKNAGKGCALKRGFKKALEMGFAYAITLDADGQHFPEDIPTMLHANQKHPGALIVGERKGLEEMERSKGSKFANAFANFWFAIQTGRRLKDTQTGFRLYPLKKLCGLSLLTSRYEAELELLVFASWHGIKIVSVPVNVYYPKPEERVSHFRPIADFSRIFILNTILCILAVVYGLPLAIWRGLMTFLRTTYALLFFILSVFLILTPAAMLYLAFTKDLEKKRMGMHKLLWNFSRFVTIWHGIPGVKFSVGNPHKENFEKPAIIICNHQSHLDLMTMLIHTPKIVCLTKDWVWNNPFYGYIIRNAEFYPVSEGTETLMPKLKSLKERGYSIAVYPEGTRSPDCSITRFHQGAFHLAQQLELDILPLVLYGAGKALPKKDRHLHKWPIRIEIDKRISPEELQSHGDTTMAQASSLRKYYRQRYAEIANKIEQDV